MKHGCDAIRDALSLVCHFVSLKVIPKSITVQALDLYPVFGFFQLSMISDGQCVECEVYCVDFDFVLACVGLQHGGEEALWELIDCEPVRMRQGASEPIAHLRHA